MDQDTFRRTYQEMNERICAYEKSILSRHCGCSQSKKLCIAEREGIHCVSDAALQQCQELLDTLRQQARFALKSNDHKTVLPHGKAMRLQIGGLRGLFSALHPGRPIPETIEDVFELINQAKSVYGIMDNLPYQTLIQQVSAYKGRQRGSHR
ncbi:MAG: hypothetical protein PVI97_01520 [Candidatus Thiodiazotropha sp.]|jgi:hypothetical protein